MWSLTYCVWLMLCGCHHESFDNFIFTLAFCKQVLGDDGNRHISSRDKPGAWHRAVGPMAKHTHTCIFWVAWDPRGLGPGPDQWRRVAVAVADNSCSHGDKEWHGIEAAPASGVGSLDLLSPEPILQCQHRYSLA